MEDVIPKSQGPQEIRALLDNGGQIWLAMNNRIVRINSVVIISIHPFLQKQKLKIIWKKELQSDQRTVTAPHWKYKCIFKC